MEGRLNSEVLNAIFQETGCKASLRHRPQWGPRKRLTIWGPASTIELGKKRDLEHMEASRADDPKFAGGEPGGGGGGGAGATAGRAEGAEAGRMAWAGAAGWGEEARGWSWQGGGWEGVSESGAASSWQTRPEIEAEPDREKKKARRTPKLEAEPEPKAKQRSPSEAGRACKWRFHSFGIHEEGLGADQFEDLPTDWFLGKNRHFLDCTGIRDRGARQKGPNHVTSARACTS